MEENNDSSQTPVAEAHLQNNSSTVVIAIAVFAVLILAGVGYEVKKKMSGPTVAGAQSTASAFKDGTYSEEGSYQTHVGEKHIKVQITLKNGVITDSTVTDEADDRMSVRYQDLFISGYKQYVTGKNITEVHLGKVSGSSLTPNGFNSALQKIEADAKS